MRTYSPALKTISVICLAFFSWTYLPLSSAVAFAATESRGTKGQKAESRPARERTTEEKFQEALDRIREAGPDRAKLKAERSKLETLDLELQKQFKETEAKIKDLPEVVKQRHRDFVKKYADSMATLKSHLNNVEQAKTEDEARVAGGKLCAFLESVRPKSRHQKLDPERLPFSVRKAKAPREPRLKKEQFEKDFPTQKHKNVAADERELSQRFNSAWSLPSKVSIGSIRNYALSSKPVLLASNEPLSDAPLALPAQPAMQQFAFSEPFPIIIAEAADQPTSADLSETPDIQFSDAIRAKAAELGYSPLRIYEWMRSSIEYAPTYGSIQGADMCLQSKICNDMDTSSLLIALYRVSSIAARYQYSTVQIDIDRAMNLVGGVTDPKMVGTILATNGVPVRNVISGGRIVAVQVERTTVLAFVDYIPSRGAVHKQGDTWIPLDPSFKTYNYTQGIDINTAVPFDAQTFANQLLSSATTNTTEGYVTNVDSNYIQTTLTDYQTRVQSYIQQNYPNATVGDVIGKKEIIKQEFGILPENFLTKPY